MSNSARDNVVQLKAPSRLGAASEREPGRLLTEARAHRRLSREWRPHLTDREYTVLAFIIDHTVGWGRERYRFTYRELSAGNPVSAGLGKAESKLREAIRALEVKRFIAIDPNKRDGLTISVNLDWNKPRCPRRRSVSRAAGMGRPNRPNSGA
jgi:hypothetical protein